MRKLLLFLFVSLLPISANATTCSAGYYLVSQNVPAGYTELEYIESTGTQYIDTGYYPNSETKTETRARIFADPNDGTGYWPALFNVRTYHDCSVGIEFGVYWNVSRNMLYYTYGLKNYGCGDNDAWTLLSAVDQADHTYITDKNVITIDGTPYSSSDTPTFTVGSTLFLFASNIFDNGADGMSKTRMYYMKIWDNNILARNFIPARRNSDGVLGMYDTVTDTFFTNSGTGTFTAGADTGTCVECTNKPVHSHYSGSGGATNSCPWQCDAGYESTGSSCKACSDYNTTENSSDTENVYTASGYNTGTRTRSKSRAVYYSSSAGGSCSISSYGDWSYGSWSYVCIAGGAYYDGNTCEWTPTGYYSPANDNGIYECTNKPSNSSYIPNAGADGNYCPWECDTNYWEYSNACHARCPYGDGELHVGQYTHPLWADITNVPSPSVYIGELGPNHDGLCYAYLEPDDTPVDNHHGFHTVHNGVPYHAINLGLYGLE